MSSIFNSLSTATGRIVRGSAFLQILDPATLAGIGQLRSMGTAAAELDISTEQVDMRENQDPDRPKLDSVTVQTDSTLKLTAMQFEGGLFAAMHLATPGIQAAPSNGPMSADLVGATAGDVLRILDPAGQPVYGLTDVTVLDAPGGKPLDPTTYRVDALTGLCQIGTPPASGQVVFSGNVPQVGSARQVFNILSQPDFYASVVIRQNNKKGANLLYTFPKVRVKAPKNIKLIANDNAWQTSEFDCEVLYDTRHPGQERGWAVLI